MHGQSTRIQRRERNLDDVDFQTAYEKPCFGGAFLWLLVSSLRQE
jgi:hypothetical protein